MTPKNKHVLAAILGVALSFNSVAVAAGSYQFRLPLEAQGRATETYNPATANVTILSANSTSLVAGTGQVVTLVALVKDAAGKQATAGQQVEWSATLGTLSGGSSTTDDSGTAVATLSAPTSIGTAVVTARASRAGGIGKTSNISIVADLSTARTTALTSTQATLPGNGIATAPLTATISDANGNPVGAGVEVAWSTTGGTLSSARSLTDEASRAQVTLTASATLGSAVITARGVASDAGMTLPMEFVSDAQFELQEATMDFGAQRFDGFTSRTLHLKNIGTTAEAPSLEVPRDFTSTTCGIIAPGATCTITVTFSPKEAKQYADAFKARGTNGPTGTWLTAVGQPTFFDGILPANGAIYSISGQYALLMQPNCVLTLWSGSTPIWVSDNVSRGSNCHLKAQNDGNLVIYLPNGTPIWHTSTFVNGVSNLSTYVYLHNTGVFGLYDRASPGGSMWESSQNTGVPLP